MDVNSSCIIYSVSGKQSDTAEWRWGMRKRIQCRPRPPPSSLLPRLPAAIRLPESDTFEDEWQTKLNCCTPHTDGFNLICFITICCGRRRLNKSISYMLLLAEQLLRWITLIGFLSHWIDLVLSADSTRGLLLSRSSDVVPQVSLDINLRIHWLNEALFKHL